ncbi:hypothetical protein, partial [Acinetobacter baumannii]
GFYYRELLLLRKYERSEFIVAFGGLRGAKPPLQGTESEFSTIVKKVPSVYPCSMLFKPLNFSL